MVDHSQEFMEKKAKLRGVQGGCNYAEAFLVEPIAENSPFFPKKTVFLKLPREAQPEAHSRFLLKVLTEVIDEPSTLQM